LKKLEIVIVLFTGKEHSSKVKTGNGAELEGILSLHSGVALLVNLAGRII